MSGLRFISLNIESSLSGQVVKPDSFRPMYIGFDCTLIMRHFDHKRGGQSFIDYTRSVRIVIIRCDYNTVVEGEWYR